MYYFYLVTYARISVPHINKMVYLFLDDFCMSGDLSCDGVRINKMVYLLRYGPIKWREGARTDRQLYKNSKETHTWMLHQKLHAFMVHA